MSPREIAEKLHDHYCVQECRWHDKPGTILAGEAEITEAIDAATKPLREEIERLKSQLHYAEKAKDTLRGERDNVVGPWWVNFEQMLTEEQRDRIGLTEDRGAVLCITRLCDALNDAEASNRALVEALKGIVTYSQEHMAISGREVRRQEWEAARAALTAADKR